MLLDDLLDDVLVDEVRLKAHVVFCSRAKSQLAVPFVATLKERWN